MAIFTEIIILSFIISMNKVSGSFIPSSGCGISKPIKTLKQLSPDFNGDVTGLECTKIMEENNQYDKFKVSVPNWKYTSWSECSVSCGGGLMSRQRHCHDVAGNVVEATLCDGDWTDQTFGCNMHSCPVFALGEWTDCSVTCDGGTRSRQEVCKDANGNTVTDDLCLPATPSTENEECNKDVPCGVLVFGEWTECSVTCDGGTRSRQEVCKDANGNTVTNDMCLPATPSTENEECNKDVPCGVWTFGEWTSCSVTCGGGTSTRETICLDANGNPLADEQCGEGYQAESQDCNTNECIGVNAKMAIITGRTTSGNTNTVEVYDLSDPSKTCEAIAELPLSAHGQSAAVYNGKIMVCGGYTEPSSTNNYKCHQYDKDTNRWVYIGDMSNSMTLGRSLSVIGGELYITGGWQSKVGDTEIWDGTSFQPGPTLPVAMPNSYHCQVVIDDNRLFVSNTESNTGESYILDWTTKQWSTVGSPLGVAINRAACGKAYSAARGIEIVAVKGSVSYIFNINDSTWRNGPTCGLSGYVHALVQVDDTFVVAGGTGYVDKIYTYDPIGNKFNEFDQRLDPKKEYTTAVKVPDGLVTCN